MKDAASLNGVTVTMYTSKEHAIKVLLPNGSSLVFSDFNDRFYTLNMNKINKYVMAHLCLQTVNKKKHISHAGKLWDQKNPDFTTAN